MILDSYANLNLIANGDRHKEYTEQSIQGRKMVEGRKSSTMVSPPAVWTTLPSGAQQGYKITYYFNIDTNSLVGDVSSVLMQQDGNSLVRLNFNHSLWMILLL